MSTEPKAPHKKRTALDATNSTPTTDVDHRKRRRNRTTQSCLNCHTSKRLCDRKRPCGRCTQLGLTGLCVYEVDDPSQRSDMQDEGSRLRKRVAELEEVIREMKNKPHPRWVQSGLNPGEEFEQWRARAQSRAIPAGAQRESLNQPSAPLHPVEATSDTNDGPHVLPSSTTVSSGYTLSSYSDNDAYHSTAHPPYLGISFPARGASLKGASDNYSVDRAMITGENQFTRPLDLASITMSYHDLAGCDNGASHVDRPLNHDIIRDGRCLDEGASYNIAAELSLRLRKAADIIMGSNHIVDQRTIDLDALVTAASGNITASSNSLNHLSGRRSPTKSVPYDTMLPNTSITSGHWYPISRAENAFLQGSSGWDNMTPISDSSSASADPLMSWEPGW
ncbi:hypothetical protein BV22DRAFT_1193828 [Leucogyrophana mollusca]|uniref:Uncharacterized protein n=1 Tax=Leucogyrophana mollusca TaxID=85980 RepID=A0ACB8BNB0_9AGAM|nr:hypothetical protein BV22DRAFT_1193828 [Leucogyrophana mollusca]